MRLDRLSTKTLRVLYRIAKQPNGGVRPFFKHPKAMIELRNLVHVDMKESEKRPPCALPVSPHGAGGRKSTGRTTGKRNTAALSTSVSG